MSVIAIFKLGKLRVLLCPVAAQSPEYILAMFVSVHFICFIFHMYQNDIVQITVTCAELIIRMTRGQHSVDHNAVLLFTLFCCPSWQKKTFKSTLINKQYLKPLLHNYITHHFEFITTDHQACLKGNWILFHAFASAFGPHLSALHLLVMEKPPRGSDGGYVLMMNEMGLRI